MKKTVALMLALVICLVSCLAAAETMEVVAKKVTGAEIGAFQTMFELITKSSGYSFTKKDEVLQEDGYDVYQYVSSDGMMELKIYTVNGKFSHMIGGGEANLSSASQSDAQMLGEWFGAALAGGVVAVYAGEGGELTTEATTQFQKDLMPLATAISTMDPVKAMTSGVVAKTTALGYPCGIEVTVKNEGSDLSMVLKLALVGIDGEIKVND